MAVLCMEKVSTILFSRVLIHEPVSFLTNTALRNRRLLIDSHIHSHTFKDHFIYNRNW